MFSDVLIGICCILLIAVSFTKEFVLTYNEKFYIGIVIILICLCLGGLSLKNIYKKSR